MHKMSQVDCAYPLGLVAYVKDIDMDFVDLPCPQNLQPQRIAKAILAIVGDSLFERRDNVGPSAPISTRLVLCYALGSAMPVDKEWRRL